MVQKRTPQILVAVLCGVCTMSTIAARYYANLTADVVMDGREIFLILGAALAGPLGAVVTTIFMVIGLMVGYPGSAMNTTIVDTTGHLFGTVMLALIYKKVIYEKVKKPFRILGWAVLVPVYYWILLMPIGSVLYYAIGAMPTPFFMLTLPIWPEVIVTTVITTLIMAALPEKWRKPLWGSPSTPKVAQSVAGMP